VPLDLTDADLATAATAATACRALAYQESEQAKKMENPTTRGPLEDAAKRYEALAAKLEAARRGSRSSALPVSMPDDRRFSGGRATLQAYFEPAYRVADVLTRAANNSIK
jgi:hypothetical protein